MSTYLGAREITTWRTYSHVTGCVKLIGLLLVSTSILMGQGSLTLSSATATGSAASLNLTLNSAGGSQPAAIQWTFTYSTQSIVSINVVAGSSATAAGKSISCASVSTGYSCVLAGVNSNVMQDGVVAVATVTLASGAATTSIGIVSALGATLNGQAVPLSSAGGTITVPGVLPTPASLNCAAGTLSSGGRTTCTITLSNANGGTVSLLSNNASLTVPATLAVGSGSTTATFTATAGTIPSDQTATITATLNGVAATAQVSLSTPATVTSVACVPAVLSAGTSSTCTVTLSKALGGQVALSSNNGSLTLPTSVSVPSGSNSAAFTATAGTIASDQTATITASLNGSSQTASLTLTTAISISSITCSPASLAVGATSTCTVILSKTDGGTVTLWSNNAALTVPASVSVPSGSTSATFTAAAGTFTTDQTATVTATFKSVSRTAAVTLSAPIIVSSLSCSPASLNAGASSTCTVTLSKAGGATVVLSSNSGSLTVPASLTIGSGSTNATFTATAGSIASDQTATITASLNGSSQTASVTLTGAVKVSSLVCSPATLNAGASSICTVTVSKTGGGTVVLFSNSAFLTVPPSVIVPPPSTSVVFVAAAGAVPSSQSATITASLNGTSSTASIALNGPPSISSLACSPSALSSGTSSMCTVSLSAAGGGTVTLSSNNPLLTAPSSVFVASGSMSATFAATAGAIASDQTATLTASLNNSTRTATIALGAPPLVTSLVCSPAALSAGMSSTCTVTLSKSGGASLALSSNNLSVAVPSSVTVSSGSTDATFVATAGAIASDQTATITASLNGVASTAAIALSAPPSLTSLVCSPATLTAGASSTCTATLSKPAGASVSLSSDNPAVTVPPSVSVPSGSATGTFAATAGAFSMGLTVNITASLNGTSRTASVALTPQSTQSLISALSCSPDPSAAGTLQCTVQLSQAAPPGGMPVALQVDSSRLQTPTQVWVPSGQQSATFAVGVLASDQDAQPQITASIAGAAVTSSVAITGIRPNAVRFATTSGSAGQWVDAEIDLNSPNVPEIARLTITSSTPDLDIPTSIITRPGQTLVTFRAYIVPTAAQQNAQVSVQFGQTVVTKPLSIMAASVPVLSLPSELGVTPGNEASFVLTAVDPGGLPLVYSVENLPPGAVFDASTGRFSWTPSSSQNGVYDIAFTATNSAQAAASGHVKIAVGTGVPEISDVRNAATPGGPACSAGALASIEGRWLGPQGNGVSSPAGTASGLNGVRVKVNGEYTSVVYASWDRVDFLCPAAALGTPLTVTLENSVGSADSNIDPMQASAPGLFSVDRSGSGQGIVYLSGTSLLAATRDYTAVGQPALPGDSISIRVTGIGDPSAAAPIVTVGGLVATVDSVKAVPGLAGIAEITVDVPQGVQPGDSVPVLATFAAPVIPRRLVVPGHVPRPQLQSNTVTIAVEPAR